VVGAEGLDEDQVVVAGVLDVVAAVAPDQADVAGLEAPTMPAAVAACVLVGAASVTFLTTGNATIQLASEPRYRGRVTALWSMAFVGSTPIGAPIVGALSDTAGPRYALALGAAACLAAVVVGRWTSKPAPSPQEADLEVLAGRRPAGLDQVAG
jgi:MFS family permease